MKRNPETAIQELKTKEQRDKNEVIMLTLDIDVNVDCASCGASLGATIETNRYGITTMHITPCSKCITRVYSPIATDKGEKTK